MHIFQCGDKDCIATQCFYFRKQKLLALCMVLENIRKLFPVSVSFVSPCIGLSGDFIFKDCTHCRIVEESHDINILICSLFHALPVEPCVCNRDLPRWYARGKK